MSGKPSSTIGFEKRFNPMLTMTQGDFVDALCDVPAKPTDMMEILRENQGRAGA